MRRGQPRELPRPEWEKGEARTWTTAYRKDEVAGAVRVETLGLDGDAQVSRHHGGPDMAVLAYPLAHYATWREEIGEGAMGAGSFGENLTVEGLDETTVCIGDVFRVGSVTFQVSQPRGPCAAISRWWNREDMLERATETGRAGFYLRILEPGEVKIGDAFEGLERRHGEWSVRRVFRARVDLTTDRATLEALASCAALSAEWRKRFTARLAMPSPSRGV